MVKLVLSGVLTVQIATVKFSFLVENYSLVSGKSTLLHLKAGGINTSEISEKITGMLKCMADNYVYAD